MSAEKLREAAALMRSRAEAVPPGGLQDAWFDAEAPDLMHLRQHDREQIASWHPAVALAVADWLDHEATVADEFMGKNATTKTYEYIGPAYVVAMTYLGSEPC